MLFLNLQASRWAVACGFCRYYWLIGRGVGWVSLWEGHSDCVRAARACRDAAPENLLLMFWSLVCRIREGLFPLTSMQLGIHLYVQPLIDLSISLDKWDSGVISTLWGTVCSLVGTDIVFPTVRYWNLPVVFQWLILQWHLFDYQPQVLYPRVYNSGDYCWIPIAMTPAIYTYIPPYFMYK